MIFAHDDRFEKALQFSRFDTDHFLSTTSPHTFLLEDQRWATAEHYYQIQKYPGTSTVKKLENASAQDAYKIGNRWWLMKRKGWKQMRLTIMTRALYSKCQQNPEIKALLLDTGDQLLAEVSAYDHYWGLGRDQRGNNHLGKIWMNIREKIRSEAAQVG